MSKFFQFLVSFVFLHSVLIGCNHSSTKSSLNTYTDSLIVVRKQLNKDLKNNPNSPIPKAEREKFVGLNYFPPNEEWVIKAKVTQLSNLNTIQLTTSTGEMRKMVEIVSLEFQYKSDSFRLIGYAELNSNYKELFIPFFDNTNGDETYAGGRYLEILNPKSDSLVIDFNTAFNPYCHYNNLFSCPIPPNENSLSLKITAGEKKWK